jgi:hypothetical protein
MGMTKLLLPAATGWWQRGYDELLCADQTALAAAAASDKCISRSKGSLSDDCVHIKVAAAATPHLLPVCAAGQASSWRLHVWWRCNAVAIWRALAGELWFAYGLPVLVQAVVQTAQ